MKKYFQDKWQQWLTRKHPPMPFVTLNRHVIYVLPSKFGSLFFLVIISLFVGSVNYQLSGGFFLTFLLVTIVMLSAWIGHQNINGLRFIAKPVKDSATHQLCQIPIQISHKKSSCFSINLIINGRNKRWETLESDQIIHMPCSFLERGYHQVPRIRVETRFPFGLFVIWSYLTFDTHVYVYPKPKAPGFWPEPAYSANQQSMSDGDEEFYTLKQSENPWKQPSRISWTTAAKGYGWYEKQFSMPLKTLYFFSTQQVSRFPLEEGLRFISFWLIESEKRGFDYVFQRQPFNTASHGPHHLTNQLRQVAIYGKAQQ